LILYKLLRLWVNCEWQKTKTKTRNKNKNKKIKKEREVSGTVKCTIRIKSAVIYKHKINSCNINTTAGSIAYNTIVDKLGVYQRNLAGVSSVGVE
jgi:hypothetical protein